MITLALSPIPHFSYSNFNNTARDGKGDNWHKYLDKQSGFDLVPSSYRWNIDVSRMMYAGKISSQVTISNNQHSICLVLRVIQIHKRLEWRHSDQPNQSLITREWSETINFNQVIQIWHSIYPYECHYGVTNIYVNSKIYAYRL